VRTPKVDVLGRAVLKRVEGKGRKEFRPMHYAVVDPPLSLWKEKRIGPCHPSQMFVITTPLGTRLFEEFHPSLPSSLVPAPPPFLRKGGGGDDERDHFI